MYAPKYIPMNLMYLNEEDQVYQNILYNKN